MGKNEYEMLGYFKTLCLMEMFYKLKLKGGEKR